MVSRLVGTGVEDRKVEARALGNLAMVYVKSNDGAEARHSGVRTAAVRLAAQARSARRAARL